MLEEKKGKIKPQIKRESFTAEGAESTENEECFNLFNTLWQ